jgi:hypothetical protein
MSLEKELETYKRKRGGWIHEGKEGLWVVIHGEEIIGMFPSLEAALEAGYERFGLEEVFMARQIVSEDHPIRSTRRAVHVPHPR